MSELEDRLAAALRKYEWADTNDDSPDWHHCPECYGAVGHGGHEPDCSLAALLAEYELERDKIETQNKAPALRKQPGARHHETRS